MEEAASKGSGSVPHREREARGERNPKRAPYPPEFRAQAVRLVRSGSTSLAGAARDLGVSLDALRSWCKQTDSNEGHREGLTTEERAELTQLRRENRVLREEREILKNLRARRHLLLTAETPVGYRRAA